MKKLVLLSIGMASLVLLQANAQTVKLFTTADDFSAFTAGWAGAPSADPTFSTDASAVNGIGNLSNPGGAGTSGSLLIPPVNGWLDAATGPSQGGNLAFLQAIDPGTDGINAVPASGNFYIDYTLPDNEGGAHFHVGVLLQYQANGYFGTSFSGDPGGAETDLGFTDPTYGEEVYRATIPYTITAGPWNGLGFGVMVDTDYNPALPFHVDNISVSVVPEPGAVALISLGLAGLLIRRRQS
jgi:PEP-CTERM motif